jgi:hypothetical protein
VQQALPLIMAYYTPNLSAAYRASVMGTLAELAKEAGPSVAPFVQVSAAQTFNRTGTSTGACTCPAAALVLQA